MAYFKQLTGSKLLKPVAKKFKVGDNKFEYGVIYKIKTDKGYFTLRNKSASNLSDGSKPRWTIDVSKKIAGTLTSVFIKHTIRSK
jgi:archaeosine-15-forming tRNA-guanine transglycosylase